MQQHFTFRKGKGRKGSFLQPNNFVGLMLSIWWFQPLSTSFQNGNLPQIGLKNNKYLSCHHPVIVSVSGKWLKTSTNVTLGPRSTSTKLTTPESSLLWPQIAWCEHMVESKSNNSLPSLQETK